MKRIAIPLIALCVALACACVLLLQPLRLISEDRTRLTLHVGKTVPLVAIAEVAGGYRCYINDAEYFWLSASECTLEGGEPLRVVFHLQGPTTIYRRVVSCSTPFLIWRRQD